VNLISRQPRANTHEREVLIIELACGYRYRHCGSRGEAAGIGAPPSSAAHWQERGDVDRDGWTDIPG